MKIKKEKKQTGPSKHEPVQLKMQGASTPTMTMGMGPPVRDYVPPDPHAAFYIHIPKKTAPKVKVKSKARWIMRQQHTPPEGGGFGFCFFLCFSLS
jgi:hypothetical protein